MATQLSRKRRVDEFWQRDLKWETDDKITITQEHIDAGEVTINLSQIPKEKTFLAWWHPGGLG